MDPALHALLTLTFTPGLGPRKIRGLLEHFGSAEAVDTATLQDLRTAEGVGPKLAGTIVSARAEAARKADAELARAERQGVTLLGFGSADYPESLAQIYDPPPVLYVRGTLPGSVCGELSTLRSLGVVGTRDASPYGLDLARRFSQALAGSGAGIVSGLALGVDTAAHEGALAAPDGRTVAVLGSGVDVVYPGQNRRLAERIADGRGAVVSEYRLGTAPRAENFPGRNRIINGLSRGVLVVEGGKRSGALITAEYALELAVKYRCSHLKVCRAREARTVARKSSRPGLSAAGLWMRRQKAVQRLVHHRVELLPVPLGVDRGAAV